MTHSAILAAIAPASLPGLLESGRIWFYGAFVLLVCFFLALDLGVFNRKSHAVSVKEAVAWTSVWVSTALLFAVAVYFIYQNHWLDFGRGVTVAIGEKPRDIGGAEATGLYLVCWMLEYALSLDNIFVIAVIFRYFGVPRQHQHRVLFWGILGALVLRGVMIGVGVAIVREFHWVIYILGGFLVYTGIKMFGHNDEEVHPEKNPVVRLARRFFPVSDRLDGEKFFTVLDGRRVMTPLFLVLIVVETTDVVFAVDSIPAAFGVTQDPFIIFTSNIFAILGLRSLYFALAAFIGKFEKLKVSLAFILVFIGVKMLVPLLGTIIPAMEGFHVPNAVSLGTIAGALIVGVVWSLVSGGKKDDDAPTEPSSL